MVARGNMLYALERYQEGLGPRDVPARVPSRGLLFWPSPALDRHPEAVQVFEKGMQAPRA